MADTGKQESCSEPVRRILAAARFAAEKHAGQKGKGLAKEPYVNHLIEVAELIATSTETLDTNLVIAGLLHDTIEDTDTTARDLEERFGSDVTSLVLEATDDKSLPKETRKALQIEMAPHKSPRAQALKLADKISNLRSILASPPAEWSLERKLEYGEWARRVVEGFTAANSVLKAQFDQTYAELAQSVTEPRLPR
jgi:GTP diphosphokinase / guanosine-3',5'-bis(diphosphate) 3'-diphosphatase